MNTPPFLLGAALLFWGWQAGCREVALVLAVALEAARWLPTRWEIEQRDFDRLWNFCAVLFLSAAVYSISAGEGPHILGDWSQRPDPQTGQPNVPERLIRAQLAFLQWWPLTLYPFVVAQAYARSPGVDWGTFSLFMRARRVREAQPGARRRLLMFHPFFAVCLGCACIGQPAEAVSFPAIALLLVWALWGRRPRRFALALWAAAMVVAIGVGYAGHLGLRRLYVVVQAYAPSWFQRVEGQADAREARTALGQVGRLKLSGKILYRVEPLPGAPVPDLLREASYNVFKSPAWLAPGGARDFGALSPGPEDTTWIVRRQRAEDAAVGIAGSLPGGQGLLPVPNGFARLEDFPAVKLSTNRFGDLRVDEGPGFFALKCRFGPGHGVDSAPEGADLEVPSEEAAAVAAVANDLGLANAAPAEVMRRLLVFFGEHYSYSLERGPRSRGRQHPESPITRFLQRERVGHCEHFATATVLLLRQAGIPARYAAGYAVQERAGAGYVVRGRHAHAWCLAYLDGHWQDFDTTPSSWLESDAQQAGLLEGLADVWSRLWFEFNKLRYGQSWLQRHAGWLVLVLLVLAALQLFVGRRWREARQTKRAAAAQPVAPGLDSEFYSIERELMARGFVRPRSENFTVWLGRLAQVPELRAMSPLLEGLLALHNRHRFDPLGLSQEDRRALLQQAQSVLAQLKAHAAHGAGPSRAGRTGSA